MDKTNLHTKRARTFLLLHSPIWTPLLPIL